MPDHRGKQEGSVYQRKDGRWVASISIDGQRHYRYGKSVWDALDGLEDIKREYHSQHSEPALRITLSQWIESWLAEIKPDIRPSTHNTYRQTLRPIREEIGDVLLGELTPLTLSEAFIRIRDRGKGARQINLCHGYLKTCLKHAVQMDIILSNPMEKVRRPKWKQRKRTYWLIDQVGSFIKTGLKDTHYWDPLFVFLCVTGLRISEAIALRWADIDVEKRSVSVTRALVWQGGTRQYDEVPPKTEAGNRDVSLPRTAIDALNIVDARGAESPVSRVFRTKRDTPPRTSDLRKHLLSLCHRAGVPETNVHGLRHVAAMLALQAVDDPYLVQQRLGHSHISITLGIYGYTSKHESMVGAQLDKMLGDRSDEEPPD